MSTPATDQAAKGLEGIIAAHTRLSDVQGKQGKLTYAGYDIDELAGKASFEEVIHLLHHGKLPTRSELEELETKLRDNRDLPRAIVNLIRSIPKEASPMHVIRTCVSSLGCFDPEAENDSMYEQRQKAMMLTARIPVITAYFHLHRQGKPLPLSDPELSEAANFLYLINGEKPTEEAEKTLDMCYVLHADHGMNASTFSSRVTIATLSDMYSAITSAIGTLKGPLHGGANEGVIKMLMEIGSEDKVDAYVEDCLAEKKKVMGIGHRVYKTLDPRAPKLKEMASKLGAKVGDPKWIRMSERIAALMLDRKGLYANVDFYSATVYYSMGIPIDLFTPIFAIARTAGWTAHVLEQLSDNRLIRPQSVYTGRHDLKYTPVDQR